MLSSMMAVVACWLFNLGLFKEQIKEFSSDFLIIVSHKSKITEVKNAETLPQA